MKLKISYEESKHWRHIQNKKVILTIYLVLRILVVATMVAQFFNGNYENVMLCVLTLVLFMLPSFCERRLHIDLPDTLEVIVLLSRRKFSARFRNSTFSSPAGTRCCTP